MNHNPSYEPSANPLIPENLQVCMLSVHTCPLAMLGGKETGGMNVYVRDLTSELARRGITVDVFTRSQDACVPRVSHELGPTAQVVHIPAGPEAPVSHDEIVDHMGEFIGRVRRFARENQRRYSVIHSHYWLSGLAGERLQRSWNGGVPLVQMFHTLGQMKNQVARAPHEFASELRLHAEWKLMRQADRVVAGSPLDKAQMAWLYGADLNRIEVIPPGVDLTRFYPRPKLEARQRLGLDPDRRLILFVGRIEPLKGIDTLLQAIALLDKDKTCDLGCECLSVAIIGGDARVPLEQMTSEMKRLQLMRSALGIDQLVTFLGKQGQDTLPDYYAAADMLVMPSHYESFGMVALEAMACGTPVIASRVGGLMYTVRDGETGLLVPDRDPHALADAIQQILKRDDLRWQLERNAIQVAQTYAWPAVTNRLLDLYTQVIQARSRRLNARSASSP